MKTKEQKRLEAKQRQIIYNSLTKEQKLGKLNNGKFVAKKERNKNGFLELTIK